MGVQVQIWEVRPEDRYVAASHFGPTYNGPLAALTFQGGVAVACMGHPRDYFLGRELKGAGGLSHIWEHAEGHELRWVGDCWKYVPAVTKGKATDPTEAMAKEKVRELASGGKYDSAGEFTVESSPGERPAESNVDHPRRRIRRARCSGCGELFRKGKLVDGLCKSCRG